MSLCLYQIWLTFFVQIQHGGYSRTHFAVVNSISEAKFTRRSGTDGRYIYPMERQLVQIYLTTSSVINTLTIIPPRTLIYSTRWQPYQVENPIQILWVIYVGNVEFLILHLIGNPVAFARSGVITWQSSSSRKVPNSPPKRTWSSIRLIFKASWTLWIDLVSAPTKVSCFFALVNVSDSSYFRYVGSSRHLPNLGFKGSVGWRVYIMLCA